MSTSMIVACKQETVKKAEEMLQEKYGEEFVVEKLGNTSFAAEGPVHSLFCHPKKDDDILFELWLNDDGTTFRDKYSEALIGKEMKGEANKILQTVSGDYIMVTDISSIVDDYTEGMRISEYSEGVTSYVILALNIDNSEDISPAKLYNAVEDIYRTWENVNGSIFLYFVDTDAMDEIKEYIKENPRVDSTLFDMCGSGFISDADGAGLAKSQDDMEQELF